MERRERVQQYYKAGLSAVEKRNWNVAVEKFSVCVRDVSSVLNYRRLLRISTYEKYGNNEEWHATACETSLGEILERVTQAKLNERWDELDQACEDGLLINPWHMQLNLDLGISALRRRYYDVAEFAFYCAINADRGAIESLIKLVDDLLACGAIEEARRLWKFLDQFDKPGR